MWGEEAALGGVDPVQYIDQTTPTQPRTTDQIGAIPSEYGIFWHLTNQIFEFVILQLHALKG